MAGNRDMIHNISPLSILNHYPDLPSIRQEPSWTEPWCIKIRSVKLIFMKKKIETQNAPRAIGPYSQAIAAKDFLFISGQLPLNPESGEMEKRVGPATQLVIDHLEAILKAHGMTLENVVRTDVFLANFDDFQEMNEAYAARFNSEAPPARQTIQAVRLPKDAVIEISCIAAHLLI